MPKITLPTYPLGAPEKNPMFFEKRVYQGSRGNVYPLPFVDKVFQDAPPEPMEYELIQLENEWVRLQLLPEIGGRIFLGQDKANQDYDFFYRQDVIKPALVGLAGPWISGGVEFNWPQHHRPGTYLPADSSFESLHDGTQIAWLSEHDPLNRLKGMHGICLHPGSALIELKGRLYNRTPYTQTFLWWANVAARVHDHYQSFFPPDVHYVADHAVRAMSSFPEAHHEYYGVDYARRPGANDLSWYRHIPVPTSYMVCETRFHFFGGYDHAAGGGFIHVANRHISPGKKQWTWGNHDFGWAWDRELTDHNGPYVELMAGVFTDNQPDFAYLHPYETKTFSQFWWPYQKIGPVQEANTRVALRLVVGTDRAIDLGVAASEGFAGLRILLKEGEQKLLDTRFDCAPGAPWQNQTLRMQGHSESALECTIFDAAGTPLLAYRPVDRSLLRREREVATEPPLPEEIVSVDELFLTGEHLEQYRHPTRAPEPYWKEALHRDPGDARCNLALGKRLISRGLMTEARAHLATSVRRLTFRHPNPVTGEAHYYLGLAERALGQIEPAYAHLYKATWDYAWRSPAHTALAEIDMQRGRYLDARQHAEAAAATHPANNKAHILQAIACRKTGQPDRAQHLLDCLIREDPLDHWAAFERSLLSGHPRIPPASRNDAQTIIDLAFDYAACGCWDDAENLIALHHASPTHDNPAIPNPLSRTPTTRFIQAWFAAQQQASERSADLLHQALAESPDYLFPSRLEEETVYRWALDHASDPFLPAYALGNYAYDKRRHREAQAFWKQAHQARPTHATTSRNLGIAAWNLERNGELALAHYHQAIASDPKDARLVAECVQLMAKQGMPVQARLHFLQAHPEAVAERDDAAVEFAALLNQTGEPERALEVLTSRRFHPWEGGEGKVLQPYTRARLLLGQRALEQGDPQSALEHFELAMQTPDSLGEKYHLLQAKAEVRYWTGRALQAMGREKEARTHFQAAAIEKGDFESMAVTPFSEQTPFVALALHALGQTDAARALLDNMRDWAARSATETARIDYFATSLPNLLVFDEEIQETHTNTMERLKVLAEATLGKLSPP